MANDAAVTVECETEKSRKTAAAKIFDTALDLFYRRGIRAVGVDEIVCGAGVTKPSLYRAFKSKDELVAACLQESAREGRAAVLAAIQAAGPDPQRRLRAVIRHFANKLLGPDYRGCLASNVAVELPEPNHPGRAIVIDCKLDMRGIVVGLARDVGAASPEVLADGLVLLIEGAIATHHIFGLDGPARSLIVSCDALIDAHLPHRAAEPAFGGWNP